MGNIRQIQKDARQAVKDALAAEKSEGYHDTDDDDDPIIRTYMGSVLSLSPSGKIYYPFACSNVDPCERCKGAGCDHCGHLGSREAWEDQCWHEAMESEASKKGGWIENGEGSANDLFLVRPVKEGE